jgi:predicted metal-dependent hydrolase
MHWQSIPVTVTRSSRARKVWLKMRSCQGIEVVLPYRVSAREVPSILERHRAWLLERLDELKGRGEAPGQNPLPEEISLDFLDRSFPVRYEQGSRAELHAAEDGLCLVLPPGQVGDGAALLQMWLVDLGKTHLIPYCRDLADCHGVSIGGVQVRNQGGRWGSCSGRFTVSLNAKLLFLSPPLVRNVVLHELCHVRHRNHGPDFKAALRSLDPLTDVHEGQMRKAWESLPAWTKWRRGDAAD